MPRKTISVHLVVVLRLAAALTFALAWTSAARSGPPLAMVEVAPGLFVHQGAPEEASAANEDGLANIGFIVGDEAVMVVDPGGSAIEGERLRDAIRAATDRPIRYVVLTHVHPDHIFGAAAFKADQPQFIGHAKLPGALAQRGDYYVGTLRRALGTIAAGSEIVPPTRLVEGVAEVDLGNRIVEIHAHGPAHTDNDLSLFDRRTATLWLSDLLFVERIPVIDGSLLGWLSELEALKAVPAARAVPGHGPVSVDWPRALEAEERYLAAVRDGTRAAIKENVDIGAAWRRVAIGEREHWLLFDAYHARNVTAAYKELEWE
jgi:quinoprotein relay system zinc metallohydrolase 2